MRGRTLRASVALFDLDRTLWDAESCYVDAAPSLALGGRTTSEELRRVGLDEEAWAEHVRSEAQSIHVFQQGTQLLADLAHGGVPMGVVTNLPAWVAKPMLEATKLSVYFTTLICNGHPNCAPKPSGDLVRAALHALQVDPSDAVVLVGDSDEDAAAAADASIRFARVEWSTNSLR